MSAFSAIPSLSPLDMAKAIGLVGSDGKINPKREQGSITEFPSRTIPAGESISLVVTFPTPFDHVPRVVYALSYAGGYHNLRLLDMGAYTATQFTVRILNSGTYSIPAIPVTISWQAKDYEYVFGGGRISVRILPAAVRLIAAIPKRGWRRECVFSDTNNGHNQRTCIRRNTDTTKCDFGIVLDIHSTSYRGNFGELAVCGTLRRWKSGMASSRRIFIRLGVPQKHESYTVDNTWRKCQSKNWLHQVKRDNCVDHFRKEVAA